MAERSVYNIVPDHTVLLALEPEEIAGIVLEYLNGLPEDSGQLNRGNFTGLHTVEQYPREHHQQILRALMEGWVWLEREGLIAPTPGSTGEWVFLTRRGRQMRSKADLVAYQRANLLPRRLLHPAIATKVVAEFSRGDYDTAVFQAFKEVEVAVRTKAKLAATDLGTSLMRKAFDAKTGPLRAASAPDAERDACAHLFAGAVGLFKNPQSHRNVAINDPAEAVELLLLASHLLRLVDRSPLRIGAEA